MATLALGFLGAAIGGSIGGTVLGVAAATIGGFIGSTIGGFVDNLLFPVHTEGPRLTDLSVQVSTYGEPIPKSFGPENPITGNVIWSSGLIESSHTVGGKGSEQTIYDYSISVAVALGDRQIRGIGKIWANDKLLYDTTIAATAIGTPQGSTLAEQAVPIARFGGREGVGFYLAQFAGGTHAAFDSIAVYPGDFTQLPDPTIESYLGAGNVPGYRGTAYVVIRGLKLADYGGRLPNLKFLVIADEEISVGEAAREIAALCGIDYVRGAPMCDILRGYTIGRQTTGASALQPLQMAYNFDTADRAGSLWFVKRSGVAEGTIRTEQLGAYQFGEQRPEPIFWTRLPVTEMPRESVVTFKDPDRDYQANSARASRQQGSADSNLSADLALTLLVDEGQVIAERTLWEAWTNQQAKTSGSDELIDVQAGCVYNFETPAGLEPLRVVTRTRGDNGVIEFDLRRDRNEVYESTAPGVPADVPSNPLRIPGQSEIVLLDIPLLIDADDNPGFYFGVTTSADDWRGSDVIRALTVSDDYEEVQPVGLVATVGDVSGTVDDIPGGYDVFGTDFDDTTVITVDLRRDSMTLSSATDAQLDAGANACFIGDPDDNTQGEVLQFGIATPVSGSDTAYELSHLRRGRRGTEFSVGLHATGEIFVLLDTAIRRADYGATDLDQEHAFKAVSLLTSESDVTAVLFTDTGVALRPYAPVDLDISGDTGGDLVLSWTGRERLSSGIAGMGEVVEAYTLRIMNSGGTVVLREVAVSVEELTYTQPMQAEDFGAAVGDLRWRVAKVSAIYGNGIFAEFNGPVPNPGSSGDTTPDAPDGTLEEVDL